MQSLRFVVRWLLATSCASLVSALPAPVSAEVAEEPRAAARVEFERGLELAKHGDYTSALAAFRAAYAKSPHFLVLYNIAQAEVALGRAIPAAEALSRYLDEGGARIPAARRKQAGAQLEWLRSRFAELTLVGAKPETRIAVNGGESATVPVAQPLRLSPGAHRISVLEPGVPPLDRVVTLAAGERQVLRLDTVPADTGTLVVECAESGVELLVDGMAVDGERAKRGMTMAAGPHRVAFSEPGQRFTERTLEVRAGESAKVSCPTPASLSGTLAVTCVEPDTTVLIDGRALPLERAEAGVALSAGSHAIAFRAPGRRFADQKVDMPGAAALMVWCGTPEPLEPGSLAPQDGAAAGTPSWFTQTQAGYLAGGAGLLLGVAAGGHYLWNRGRYADWRTEDRALAASNRVPDYRVRQDANNELANSIDRASRVTVGLTLAGGALISTGILLVALDSGHAKSNSGGTRAWERIQVQVGGLPGNGTAVSYSGTLP